MKRNCALGILVLASTLQAAPPAFAGTGGVVGGIIGGLIGGAAGSAIGKGNGNKAAIIIGAIGGALIGNRVGQNMQDQDRRAMQDAQYRGLSGPIGQPVAWNGSTYGSTSGCNGNFTSTREGYNQAGEYCREYHSVITNGAGQTEQTDGIACTRQDGSWYEDQQRDVRFNDGSYLRPPAPPPGFGPRPAPYRPPMPPPPPMRPAPPPPPVYSGYPGSTEINSVTRQSGGDWYRVSLDQPLMIQHIELRVRYAQLRVYEASVITESGNRYRLGEMTSNLVHPTGSLIVANRSLSVIGERIVAMDLRMESFGEYADVMITAYSNEGYPSLQVNN